MICVLKYASNALSGLLQNCSYPASMCHQARKKVSRRGGDVTVNTKVLRCSLLTCAISPAVSQHWHSGLQEVRPQMGGSGANFDSVPELSDTCSSRGTY
jgi:hypothetical protein